MTTSRPIGVDIKPRKNLNPSFVAVNHHRYYILIVSITVCLPRSLEDLLTRNSIFSRSVRSKNSLFSLCSTLSFSLRLFSQE